MYDITYEGMCVCRVCMTLRMRVYVCAGVYGITYEGMCV